MRSLRTALGVRFWENRSACMLMPQGDRFGKTELRARKECVRFRRTEVCARKDGSPRTKVFNVILWDDSCILGLSAIL